MPGQDGGRLVQSGDDEQNMIPDNFLHALDR